MRKVTARVLTLALLVVTAMVIPGVARASTHLDWNGVNGADHLPCGSDVHWVLASAQGVTGAELFVNGKDQGAMEPNNGKTDGTAGSWSIISQEPVDSNSTVYVEYDGTSTNGNIHLTISDCTKATTTTTTTITTTPGGGGGPGTPNTGFNPLPFVALGLILLSAGALVLRRKTA